MQKRNDLSFRLIEFAASCISVAENVPQNFAAQHIASQLIRSVTSPALHYGEAQAAESAKDFIHKMKICLKELRESMNSLQLMLLRKWYDENILTELIKENNELIAIFVASINTASKKLK